MSDKNHQLDNTIIMEHSSYKAWWCCSKCPDGHPHTWKATVNDHSNGSGCPYCSGRAVCKHNSLATISPATVQYWHKEKNLPLSPETVTSGSGFRAHWVCPACLHELQCRITKKVQRISGCPECAKARGNRSKNGVRQKHPTFASCNHPLLPQWDHVRNAREGNYPDNTTLRSHKRIWWTCDQCPKGNKHSWSARCYNRTGPDASGCPMCSGKLPCDCNSLQSRHPEYAADFDSKANGVTPDQVTASSHVKYRWLSDIPEAALRSVNQRTRHKQHKLKRGSQAGHAAQGLSRKVSTSHYMLPCSSLPFAGSFQLCEATQIYALAAYLMQELSLQAE